MENKVKVKTKKEEFDVFQICNLLQFTRYNRKVVESRFTNEKHTKEEWGKIFKNIKLNF